MSDGIVLTGLPGAGKTTVGRLVARRLGRAFVDIDDEIARLDGRRPHVVLAEDGEPKLREIERHAVSIAIKSKASVISTGGGTFVDPLNRWLLMEHGVRVRLETPIPELAARLLADAETPRPLLTGDLEGGLERTREARAAEYAAVDAVIDSSRAAEIVADEVIALAACRSGWRPLLDARFARHVPFGPERGRLLMGRRLSTEVISDVVGSRIPVVIADRVALNANPLVGDAFAHRPMCVMDGGEQVKTMARLEELLAWLSELQVERDDPLVVVGGGTIGDLGGLAAALHRRGIPLVNVPTTWLAQADSAIGGKVAVDLPAAKNGVGTFWPACAIVDDADVLASLPIDSRRNGIAECLKAGLIGDPLLWELVEKRGVDAVDGSDAAATFAMTERAVRVKLEIVDRDPFESGERRKLNLGHTLGHALEVESGYSLAHGAAVALGLRAVAVIALGRGAQADLAER
ncbi:MAG TPA: bifunctional shikimate kinase/3-dehydroquinate synthase, partial [Candidatus Limnocylindrales bacterium]